MTTRDDRIRQAIEAASDALVDAHYWEEDRSLPGATVLAEIAIQAAADVLCPPDHLHYTIEFEAEHPDVRWMQEAERLKREYDSLVEALRRLIYNPQRAGTAAFMAEVEANDKRLFEALDRTQPDGSPCPVEVGFTYASGSTMTSTPTVCGRPWPCPVHPNHSDGRDDG